MTPDPTPDAPVVPTLTLAGFVSARLSELAAVARAATPGPWGDPADYSYGEFGWYVYGCPAGETEDSEQGKADIQFIAANHPAAVLASVEADRRILAPHIPDREHPDPWAHDVCPACTTYGAYDHTVVYEDECDTLRFLASKWVTHPDWREDWA